ncbi:endolytic transglycosylase MltG [Sphingomonas sp. LY29]|uniref:endolytic transglycosylase MltG n=1 Tax=unclassified Sphingomonas TaxID=196159 RepID=UPI002ADEBA12|nr:MULTISPECIES: endolytic transglycosylase MltG [unclassified Sphingomonas]MEA1071535.1 endolytic transglycosylase MltG [Sphingomonas sp. LY160]WRP25787.1 endolytic transglycosylase MltG [Sphingomonas sp. LY29]
MLRRLAWLIGFALGAVAVLTWLLWFRAGPTDKPQPLLVEQGSSVAAVAKKLEQAKLIRGDATTFRAFAKFLGGGDPVQAGEFDIPAGSSPAAILDLLQHGRPVQRLLTIPEGMPAVLVQERLAAMPFATGPAPLPAEGRVLPDSYTYERGEARAAVLKRMTDAMDKELAVLWAKRKPACPVNTPQEAVTLASIVEKETSKPSERRTVAGVYCNRLKIGMKLDADPTVIYPITKGKPLGRRILRSELNSITGYNTYREVGLPAGPIANPGRESIAAVLDPAPTKALYFVADGTGGHVFADTLQQHNANVAKWYALRRSRGEM